MTPRDKLATVEPDTPLQVAMEVLLEKNIGCVVVLEHEKTPVGILTNRDLVQAYHDGLSPYATTVRELMKTELIAVRETDSRDEAAATFQHHRNHHAVVINDDNQCVGLVSAWDIVVECAAAHRAWPWNRSNDGRFYKPSQQQQQQREDPALESLPAMKKEPPHAFADYIDSVRSLPFMDD